MTTLPPEPAGSSPAGSPVSSGTQARAIRDTHKQRQVAEGFGDDAERYDRARPSYPDALIDRILAASPGRDILDVGSGTGIVGSLLRARGCRVLGVEPDPRMAEVARGRGLETEIAKIEDWDPAGRLFDAAVAGQAWHWVDPVAGAAAVARALRPGGPLALFWNVFGLDRQMREAFGAAYQSVDTGLPFNPWSRPLLEVYLEGCERAAGALAEAGGFGAAERWRFEWDRLYTRDEWLDVVPTVGGHSRIPDEAARSLYRALGEAVDSVGGSFTVHYTTVAVIALRAGARG